MLVRAFLPGEPVGGRTDTELVDLATGALRRLAGVTAAPALVRVASFDGTMPRYTVGHLDRVARAERALAGFPAIRLAGAPYRGVGLPDCIAGAGIAAAAIREHLGMADVGTSVEPEAVSA
jgi:oxygen-dependent protoporphyrinogen oxidase